jgi:Winged helix-turn helix
MRPVSVFANPPGSEIGQLQAALHGRWRQATRAVMVLLSAHGLPPAQIAELLDCHPATVRRWISRFNGEGMAGLADRPRCGVRGWAGSSWPGGSPRCWRVRVRGRCRGSTGTWDGRRSARRRCTGGSGWWRSGGGRS